ncbi:MAG: hypothetical protein JRE16_03595 [Deltaproteobacteria bacterium]|nr:hypothetical protein [Deltaproteobacteria bacterium]MBW2503635.1 hypothetical protein [Deltaproteobacteria bacterium]
MLIISSMSNALISLSEHNLLVHCCPDQSKGNFLQFALSDARSGDVFMVRQKSAGPQTFNAVVTCGSVAEMVRQVGMGAWTGRSIAPAEVH